MLDLWIWENRAKTYLRYFFAYITIVGIVTFSLFLHEEAIQTAIWGTWPAQDAKQWHLVKKGLTLVNSINTSMKIINYCFGWIQPLALIAYYQYAKATDYYIESLNAKIFANAPELYIGEKVKLEFIPREIRNGELAINGRLGVYLKDHTKAFTDKVFNKVRIEGTVFYENNLLIIR
jgi:hypothetical protein